MNADAVTRSRVIVAIGSSSPDPATLGAAARLAHVVRGELAALFVEDINLLRLAELPIAFEIGAALPTPRRLAPADIERGFRSEADALRQALAEIGNALQLDFTFDVVRGNPAHVLFDASSERDLIVLAGTATRALTHRPSASIVRHALRAATSGPAARHKGPVAAMLHAGSSAIRVLAVAHELAQADAAELVLLLEASDDSDPSLVQTVERWLKEQAATARVFALGGNTLSQMADIMAQTGSRVLFWPGDGEREMTAAAQPLLASISCPLVVVR